MHSRDVKRKTNKSKAALSGKSGRAYVAGTFDTKARELCYLRDCLVKQGIEVTLVDLSTSAAEASPDADIAASRVATRLKRTTSATASSSSTTSRTKRAR